MTALVHAAALEIIVSFPRDKWGGAFEIAVQQMIDVVSSLKHRGRG